MRNMHRFLSTTPFDLYELALFHLVLKHRSFTKAAEVAGLTQSAITRQIQGVENSLGIPLLERTTRTVRATSAGEFLQREAAPPVGRRRPLPPPSRRGICRRAQRDSRRCLAHHR